MPQKPSNNLTFWILHLQKNQQNYIHIILPTYVAADFEFQAILKNRVSLKKKFWSHIELQGII